MLRIVLLSLATVALAQFRPRPDWLNGVLGSTVYNLDMIHGHTVQYDDRHDLVILVGRDNCYLVDAPDTTWDQIAHDKDTVPMITEEIYHLITSKTGLTQMTHSDAEQEYHSRLEEWECRSKDIFKLKYTPVVPTSS
uniref:Anoxia-induced grl-like protein n=1 Tax=Littorina littorea TaxID=31216 RepID=Q1EHI9_LITLI|nr:anoxia-induced grl-like protein [Littorina littorea]